ncbi:MAG: hypothetical protein QG635_531, partial [Bacteroidota bacterium]|nr:hypothetical protein [Bacteroidota bacterium]
YINLGFDNQQFIINAGDLGSGVYFLAIVLDGIKFSGKIVLMK